MWCSGGHCVTMSARRSRAATSPSPSSARGVAGTPSPFPAPSAAAPRSHGCPRPARRARRVRRRPDVTGSFCIRNELSLHACVVRLHFQGAPFSSRARPRSRSISSVDGDRRLRPEPRVLSLESPSTLKCLASLRRLPRWIGTGTCVTSVKGARTAAVPKTATRASMYAPKTRRTGTVPFGGARHGRSGSGATHAIDRHARSVRSRRPLAEGTRTNVSPSRARALGALRGPTGVVE